MANAYRYGKPPISLLIEPDPAAQSVAILVEDHGTGIDDAKWAEIGQRFERNKTAGSGSHGLGLAITHSVSVAHGGRMVACRSASGAFRCGMILPLAAGKDQRGARP
ncbi:MAG TPA: ATP-binding protein, partial [Paracoccaceae bacterium]